MNFKYLLLLALICGCGVKGDPKSPKTPVTHSLMQNYPDIETETPVEDVRKQPKSPGRRNN